MKEKHFAVLLPLIKKNGEDYILFEQRSMKLRSQPGEICFPGGMVEPDESFLEAAIRETCEELLIQSEQIEIIKELEPVRNPGGMILHPYLGRLNDYENSFSKEEVDRVIAIKKTTLENMTPECYYTKVVMQPEENFPYHLIPGGRDYPWKVGRYEVYFYQAEGEVIWGLTAKILRSLFV